MSFLFATGIENGYPVLPNGTRVDRMDASGHYAYWERDFALARELGVDALHYGPAYYLVHTAPDIFDFSVSDEPMERLRELGLEVIADLCHFGVPSWMDGFQDPAFPVHFAEYARAFARRYPWVRYYTPVREIFTAALSSAYRGEWNECAAGEAELATALRHLCTAHEMAVDAILSERPDAVIIQTESVEQYDGATQPTRAEAERWNAIKMVALDLTLGRELAPTMAAWLHEHGLRSNELRFFRETRARGRRWLGLAYHERRERRVGADGRTTDARGPLGLRCLAVSYYHRCKLPLFVTESGGSARTAPGWLSTQWRDVTALRRAGIPVRGFSWQPLTDRAEPALLEETAYPSGLADARRRIRPVGEAYRRLIEEARAELGERSTRLRVVESA
ncbi:MAG TPA: family 1 glycosylhydrolase [Gemmatimonadaceae bacterium]|jgi:beta-glucosidase/6-phospho-beta-glucosidase/beta-galactosidase|nr:family 1 glycosylhydrolase [Gemmatimonadaceae bacterium]